MDDYESLQHTRWECKYQVSFCDGRSVGDGAWAVARAPQTEVWIVGMLQRGQVMEKHLTVARVLTAAVGGSQQSALSGSHFKPLPLVEVLTLVMNRAIERHQIDAASMLAYLYKSPLFEDAKKDIIAEGLAAYLRKDGLISIHLLIPQIEGAVRNLAERCGAPVLKPMRGGGFSLRTLDELLRDCVGVLGESTVLYLRVLLTDPRGWNLRNDVCHGTLPASHFGMEMADWVIHSLLLLGRVRSIGGDKPKEGSTGDWPTSAGE